MRMHAAAGMCCACWWLVASGALAEQPGLGLNWVRLRGAESCVTATQLMNQLEARAGRILFVRSGEATLSIDGYVAQVSEPQGWAVTLELSDAHGKVLGHRDLGVLPGTDCKVVADTALLILDLTLDPDGTLGTGIPLAPETQRQLDELLRGEPSELDPSSLPRSKPEPAKPPGSRSRRSSTRAKPAAKRQEPPPAAVGESEGPAFDAGALGGIGELPGVSLGVALHATLPTRVGLTVELGVASAPTARRGEGSQQADSSLLLGALALCPWQPVPVFSLCGGAEYGSQRVSPTGLGQALPATQPLVDLLAYASTRVSLLGPLFLQVRAGAVVPLLRNAYRYRTLDGVRTLYRTAAVGARAELGLGLKL
jgi:hypothetical protein